MNKIGLANLGFFRTSLAVSLPLVLATSVLAQAPTPPTTQSTTVRSFNENGTEESTTERIFIPGRPFRPFRLPQKWGPTRS